MKSAKAELEEQLKALQGVGPVGLKALEKATGRNARTMQRWAEQDPAFRKLLEPFQKRHVERAPPAPAPSPASVKLDARLVERYAEEAERSRQLEEDLKTTQ